MIGVGPAALPPADAEACAARLDAQPDYRVARRLVPVDRRRFTARLGGSLVGVALDVETTGLDPARHSIVELAMQRFLVSPAGEIVETGRMRRWLEDPGEPLGAEITRLTGLVDEDLRGRSICDAEATSVLLDADFVVAHNARFDRPRVESRLPLASGRPWVCTLAEVPWRELGFESRNLPGLLLEMGWFYSAHSAAVDVQALIRLLDHRLVATGATVVSTALAAAGRRTWVVEAVEAPFAAKDGLKARGYRWDPAARFWAKEVSEDLRDGEIAWATARVYGGGGSPRLRSVDWTVRHADH